MECLIYSIIGVLYD